MPGSDVYVMSEMVRKEFNKKFAPIERRQRAPSRKKREYTPPAEDVEMVEAAPRAPRTRRATPKKKAAKKEALPMTKEEKRLLSQAINHLPSDNLGMVVRIIQQSLPHINDQAEEIEIDIDALDAVTLRQLEDYVNDVKKKRTPKPKKASPAPAPKPQNKLDQAERTASGTQQKITDIEKQIESLNNESSALQTKPKKDEDVVIDDEDDAQATAYPPVVIDKDQSSDSDSSDSETGTSSDSGSGSEFESDTESESEKSAKAAAASAVAPAAAPAAAAAAPAAPAAEEEADVPQILPSSTASTTQKLVPLVNTAQWQQSLGASTEDAPVDVPEEKKLQGAPLWSEFKHKDSLQKQKEKEKQEREEKLRRELDEQEAKRRAEEERKNRELAEAEERKREAEEAARLEAERKLEEQRLQEKKEREAKMRAMEEEDDGDAMDLESFATSMGSLTGPPADMLRQLDGKEDGEL